MICLFAGLATLDVVHHVDNLPGRDVKATAQAQFVGSGGPAANAAKTYAALGGRARLVTALGRSSIARLVRADLEDHGVEVIDVAPESEASPPVSSVAVLPTGERTVLGNEVLPLNSVGGADAWLDGVTCLLLDGHHAPLAVAAARAAGERGVRVVVDAGRPKPVFHELWPYTHTAICSSDYRLSEKASIEESADGLLGLGVKQVAFTDGPHPIRWWARETSGEIIPWNATVLDTLGAGDVMHGAYCYFTQYSPRALFPDVLEAAANLATERTEHLGLAGWLADLRRA